MRSTDNATVTDATAAGRATDRPELGDHVRAAVLAAADKKAIDLRVLDLRAVCDFSDCFLIATGANERQVQAIAETIERRLRALGERPIAVEGLRTGKWVLLDYADLVVHVFQPDTRTFYGLERLWADAEDATEQFATAPAEPAAPLETTRDP